MFCEWLIFFFLYSLNKSGKTTKGWHVYPYREEHIWLIQILYKWLMLHAIDTLIWVSGHVPPI